MQIPLSFLLTFLPLITATPLRRDITTTTITSHSSTLTKDGTLTTLSQNPPTLDPTASKLLLDCSSALLTFPPNSASSSVSLKLSHTFSLTPPPGYTIDFGRVTYAAWVGLTRPGLRFGLTLKSSRNGEAVRSFKGQEIEGPTMGSWGDVTFWPIVEEVDVRVPGLIEAAGNETCKATTPPKVGRRGEVETEFEFEWRIERDENGTYDGTEEGWFEVEKDADGKGLCEVEVLWGKCI